MLLSYVSPTVRPALTDIAQRRKNDSLYSSIDADNRERPIKRDLRGRLVKGLQSGGQAVAQLPGGAALRRGGSLEGRSRRLASLALSKRESRGLRCREAPLLVRKYSPNAGLIG